jgi:signal transduction histidine kinase
MRTLIFELRPRSLETDGLAQALRNHAAAITSRTGLEVAIDVSLDERLDADTEQALYRIGQEALHNVVKHANATSAQVTLARVGTVAQLVVDDDGAGFDPGGVSRGTLGLIGMRQRAEQVGGTAQFKSRPGGGTRVEVSVPIDDPISAD